MILVALAQFGAGELQFAFALSAQLQVILGETFNPTSLYVGVRQANIERIVAEERQTRMPGSSVDC